MPQTLYFLKDDYLSGRTGFEAKFFGIKPSGKGSYNDFHCLSKEIKLKENLKWKEVQNLQKIFCGAEIWEDFPAQGLKFIFAELKAGDEEQRIDILYIRDDGGLYPCELKLGGTSKDTHGQLIRYISDLHYQDISKAWLIRKRIDYLKKRGVSDQREHALEKRELDRYFKAKKIQDRHFHLIRNAGIIVDEDFTPQMLRAVRYLNEVCGFSIRLLRMRAWVDDDWKPRKRRYRMRIDIVEMH